MFVVIRIFFARLIVHFMTDSVIEALANMFTKQQADLDRLADSLNSRQQAIDAVNKAYTDNQDKLAALQHQLSSDTQVQDLSAKVDSSTQSLSKLVTQAQALKVPTLPTKQT